MSKRDCYMVLSLKELRKLVNKAKNNSKARYNGKILQRTCIVIDIKIQPEKFNSSVDGAKQLQIVDFS